jgi:hypothetical protein
MENGNQTESFLRDVAGHTMAVMQDNGVYRHIRFRQASPASWNMWFDLVTWPGNLAIRGDMGTWVFSRVEDMFTLFRSRNRELRINASYWCEKVESESRFGGPSRKFDGESFKANVLLSLDGYGLEDEEKQEITAVLQEEVFSLEDELSARKALADFEYNGFSFQDPWEIQGQGYSHHFIWCLHAIVWGIQQYDKLENLEPAGDAAAATAATKADTELVRCQCGSLAVIETPAYGGARYKCDECGADWISSAAATAAVNNKDLKG